MNGAPDQAGNWRVAQLPQWNEGDEVSAEDGGSALAVVSQSKQQAAAYKFVEYLTHGDGAQTMADTGTFPSLKKILSSDSFTDPNTEANKKVNDYFGGQNVNEILSEAAQRKSPPSSTCRTTRTRSPPSAIRSPRPTARTSLWRKLSSTTARRSPITATSRLHRHQQGLTRPAAAVRHNEKRDNAIRHTQRTIATMKIDGRWESSDVTRLPHFAKIILKTKSYNRKRFQKNSNPVIQTIKDFAD